MPQGPLDGIRVLDLSSFLAGPYATALLGDLGAEVIKVEPPAGDLGRQWSPFLDGEGRFFQAWNRNKRSIALDLAQPAARDVLFELVRRADILVENYRSGVAAKLGIGYETLRTINPRLIYASCTAFGSRGPDAARPGYDPVLQTASGTAFGNHRYNGGVTAICVVAVSDYQAGMLLIAGALAALYRRTVTGEGQHIETSLLQAVMTVNAQAFVQALDAREEGAIGIHPYRGYHTRDGWLFVAAGTDRFWRSLCGALGRPDLARDERYATNGQRVNAAAEISAELEPIFAARTTAEWERILLGAEVPCGGARTYAEFFDDPQVTAMDMNPVIEHPKLGRLRVIGVPVQLSDTPGAIQRAAPLLGEHSDEVLRELGLGGSIAALRASGAVR